MKKKALVLSLTIAAVLCFGAPAAAETYTSPDGILSIELPNENWKEITDLTRWVVLSDGGNTITIDHYSNGEKLPDMTVADDHYVNVYQAVFSTQNEVFVITGSVVDADVIPEIANAIISAKVLRYDTKLAVRKDDQAAPSASEISILPLDKTMYVTSSGLNVRTGCSTDDQIIGAFAYGSAVHVTGSVQRNGADIGWYQVTYNAGSGYVSAEFLSDTQPAAAQTASGSDYTSEVKTIYKIDGSAVTIYKSTDGYWYDKPGNRYTQITDFSFESQNGVTFTINKPQDNVENVPVGDPFTVFWQNGNATELTKYSDGYFYSSEWVRYTSDGEGTYYGADGTVLYLTDPWSYNDSSQESGDGTISIQNDYGEFITLYESTDGYWISRDGTAYVQASDGSFIPVAAED